METNYVKNENLVQVTNMKFSVRKTFYRAIKRCMDVVCSLIALILLSPLLLITAIAIFIDDPGPILFKQIRIGKDSKPFKIWKFRSMKTNAEELKADLMKQNEDKGANFKIEHDPRITRVGKFIRDTSIDELPQLINILKGDMAVIGPRPFIEEEQKNLPSDRLAVKPGLSCYWQIGGKNSLPLPEQIELDRKYIREQSVFVDVKIIMKTMLLVVNRKNK
ncbi:sugar transferase [Ruminococcus sp.]|uniref:sugar transferase n=1 Tax=Ruminococcus sp. TaxID=41978 RepID=UPI0025D35C9D|nr:sugar transferase [Ruminococcus sp.]